MGSTERPPQDAGMLRVVGAARSEGAGELTGPAQATATRTDEHWLHRGRSGAGAARGRAKGRRPGEAGPVGERGGASAVAGAGRPIPLPGAPGGLWGPPAGPGLGVGGAGG